MPDRRRAVRAARSAEAGAPLGPARRGGPRRRLLPVRGLRHGANGGGAPELLLGFVLLVVGHHPAGALLPGHLGQAGRARPDRESGWPCGTSRRYRARSGSALSAISLGVLIAVMVCVLAAARYGNVLDYAGPNVASNQLIVYTANGPYGPRGPEAGNSNVVTTTSLQSMTSAVQALDASSAPSISWRSTPRAPR